MKTNSKLLALSLGLLLAFGGSSAMAQQQRAQAPKKQVENVKKSTPTYTTEKFYFTKSKLSKSALQKKLLKTPGVKSADIDMKNKCINIVYDNQKAPKTQLKKNLKGWGTPGDFHKTQSTQSKGKQQPAAHKK